jgi:hypothetical protein
MWPLTARGLLGEFGLVVPKGVARLRRDQFGLFFTNIAVLLR